MSAHFKAVDREPPYLFPPSMQDWLGQRHLARFVVDVVSKLDLGRGSLRPVCGRYKRERGMPRMNEFRNGWGMKGRDQTKACSQAILLLFVLTWLFEAPSH